MHNIILFVPIVTSQNALKDQDIDLPHVQYVADLIKHDDTYITDGNGSSTNRMIPIRGAWVRLVNQMNLTFQLTRDEHYIICRRSVTC